MVPLVSNNDLFINLNVMKFKDVYRYFLLKFFHKSFYSSQFCFDKYFSSLLPPHNYNTRDIFLNLPYARTEKEKQGTIFQCCRLVRSLDISFLSPMSNYVLKAKFRTSILDSYRELNGPIDNMGVRVE